MSPRKMTELQILRKANNAMSRERADYAKRAKRAELERDAWARLVDRLVAILAMPVADPRDVQIQQGVDEWLSQP